MNRMKVLVTGATGFLGTKLCHSLEKKNFEVIKISSKNADLTQFGSLNEFDEISFKYIFHLAAWTQAGDFCLHHPGEQWIINQKINTNVLEWWQLKQAQAKLVSIGTSCSYSTNRPLQEEYYLEGTPIESLYTYGMTKRMMQIGLFALNKQYGLSYLTVVPSTLYGADYHTDGRQMHFIFDLIRKILRGKIFKENVELWGNGEQKRELVLVDDFVNILMQLVIDQNNQIINIGAGKEYTIKHFAGLICKKIGYDFEDIKFDVTKYVGAKSKCLDITKLKSILPEYELTPLEIGLDKTIDWFIETKSY
jgi:GDP-L-fucose synthase